MNDALLRRMASEVLVGFAGLGFCTPEEGYLKDPGHIRQSFRDVARTLEQRRSEVDEAGRNLAALEATIERSGFDVQPCLRCGEGVVCIPDGMVMCEPCAASAAVSFQGEEVALQTFFPNLAGGEPKTVDDLVYRELTVAGISAAGPIDLFRAKGEVPSGFIGALCQWTFERAWKYWVATGPGIPPEAAEAFHQQWGEHVRVEGHCRSPSPLKFRHGFAIGFYHIDSQEGLCAFADLLRSIDTRRRLVRDV